MTDFVQGIMTIIFSFMLLPVVLGEVGGLSGMRETIAGSEALGDSMLSLVAPAKINTFYVAMLSVNVLFLIVALPSVMGNCAKSVTIAPPNPPATPYTTNRTVIRGMATFASIAPPVPASIKAPAPINMRPIFTDIPRIPTIAKSTATFAP